MANHRGLREGKTPARVLALLADGRKRTLKQIAAELSPDAPLVVYNGAATALNEFCMRGKVQRERARGRYLYWRDVQPEAAAS